MSLDPINLASDLIKIKSITPHGKEAINLIKSILENHGFDCKILTFGEGEDEVVNLYKQGRRKIGFITTIHDLNVGKFRANGFRKASFDLFGSFDKNRILKISKLEDKHLKIKNFLQKTRVDSVISADIVCGVITINIARSLGLTIPDQLSVVGFGDNTISDYSTPRLSAIEQNGNQIGSRSVDLLVDRMNSKWFGLNKSSNVFSTEIIPTNSIPGESKDNTQVF